MKGGSWKVNRGGFLNHYPALKDQATVSSPLQDKVNKKINISVARRRASSLCHALETNRGPSGSQGERCKLVIWFHTKSYSGTQQPSKGLRCRASASLSISHTPWGVLLCLSVWRMLPSMSLLTELNPALIISLCPVVNKYKFLLWLLN